MTSETRDVLHSWCVQAEWSAPTVTGGSGAFFEDEHGLFAVVELVMDRTTREPVSPWPQVHPSLRAFVERNRREGVSFAVHGNLVILAPPLVVGEADLTDALALMERLLTELSWS